MKISRLWLEGFLGKDFLVHYLGDSYYARPFIIMLIGFVTIFAMEFVSLILLELQNTIQVDELIHKYELSFGIKEDWNWNKKEECLRAVSNIITLKRQGLITKIMSFIY